MSFHCLNGVALDKLTFCGTLSMSFQNVDRFDWIFSSKNALLFNRFYGLNYKVREEVGVCIDEFARHGCF